MNSHQPKQRGGLFGGSVATVLVVMLVISAVAHIGLILGLSAQPIGYVNLSDLLAVRTPVRVKRATQDFLQSPTSEAGQDEAGLDLSAVSEALLQGKSALPEDVAELDIAMRETIDQADAGQPEIARFDHREFTVADEDLQLLEIGRPTELLIEHGRGGFGGTSKGYAAAGSGGAKSAALLQQAGLPGGRIPEPIESDTPPLAMPEPKVVKQMIDIPLAPAAMDFASIALKDTENLELPEHLDDDFDYLVTRQPSVGNEAGYFKVEIVPRRSLRRLKTMPKDVVFLIDTSASIPQTWVQQMVAGVKFALGSLNPGDRFNIMMFSDRPRLFSQTIQPATNQSLERALKFLDDAESAGATDVNAALSRLLTRDLSQQRVYNLVLISDGRPTRGVMDTRDLINIITKDNDLNASIYCVGVGPRVNRELLDFLAYRNKGFSVFVDDRRRVATVIRELMSRLRYPLIKDVTFNVAGLDAATVFPTHLPNIHQSERFAIFGRYQQPVTFTFQISGRTAGGRAVDFTFTRNLADAPRSQTTLSNDWAFWKLHDLYSQITQQGQTPTLMRQIEQLKQRYGIKSVY